MFAAGDIALVDGLPLPQLAQPAIQSGRHAARQVARLVNGRVPRSRSAYHDKGIMATVGRRSAVVELPHGARSAARWPGWPGSACTCSTCSAAATGCPR